MLVESIDEEELKIVLVGSTEDEDIKLEDMTTTVLEEL